MFLAASADWIVAIVGVLAAAISAVGLPTGIEVFSWLALALPPLCADCLPLISGAPLAAAIRLLVSSADVIYSCARCSGASALLPFHRPRSFASGAPLAAAILYASAALLVLQLGVLAVEWTILPLAALR